MADSCGLATRIQVGLDLPPYSSQQVWGFIFYMEQDFSDMTRLHLDAYVSLLSIRKIHSEIELAQYTKVMSYINDNMDGYAYILENIEQLVGIILTLDREITEARKWQR